MHVGGSVYGENGVLKDRYISSIDQGFPALQRCCVPLRAIAGYCGCYDRRNHVTSRHDVSGLCCLRPYCRIYCRMVAKYLRWNSYEQVNICHFAIIFNGKRWQLTINFWRSIWRRSIGKCSALPLIVRCVQIAHDALHAVSGIQV